MDVADSGLAPWLGWMERSSHHVPKDPLEFLKTQKESSETWFGPYGPLGPPGFQPHAVALPLNFL
jgi:hypothetical protein